MLPLAFQRKKNVLRESAQRFIELEDAIDLFWNAFYSTYVYVHLF